MSADGIRLRENATHGPTGSVIGALLVFALMAVGGPPAQAMAPEPTPEDNANAAVLMAAPWLVCSTGPDAPAAIPAGMRWNWDMGQFEEQDNPGKMAVIPFDDKKHRGKFLEETRGKLWCEELVPNHDEELHPYSVSLRSTAVVITVSRRRTANGAMIQTNANGDFFSLGPTVLQMPLSCAATADDAPTRQIERARVEWWAAPAANTGTAPP
jgi:hypothetical protein